MLTRLELFVKTDWGDPFINTVVEIADREPLYAYALFVVLAESPELRDRTAAAIIIDKARSAEVADPEITQRLISCLEHDPDHFVSEAAQSMATLAV